MVLSQIWEKNMEMSMTSKAELRKEMLKLRSLVCDRQREMWDTAILERIKSFPALQREPIVYCYVSVRGETGTERILQWLWKSGIRVALPRVCKKEMAFYYCTSPSDLVPGAFHIPEPADWCKEATEQKAPVIVPGVAFSEAFQRIGYGAGYYDRFFSREPEHLKIGICYDFQHCGAFDAELHDISMDAIITQSGLFSRTWI